MLKCQDGGDDETVLIQTFGDLDVTRDHNFRIVTFTVFKISCNAFRVCWASTTLSVVDLSSEASITTSENLSLIRFHLDQIIAPDIPADNDDNA